MEEQNQTTQETPQQDVKPLKKQEYVDKIKIRCRYCGHRIAVRRYAITNIREAVYVCEFCGRRIR